MLYLCNMVWLCSFEKRYVFSHLKSSTQYASFCGQNRLAKVKVILFTPDDLNARMVEQIE